MQRDGAHGGEDTTAPREELPVTGEEVDVSLLVTNPLPKRIASATGGGYSFPGDGGTLGK